jgi:isopenicillin-N epimerase
MNTRPDGLWSLSEHTHHLNHGSFGAVPVPVQARQSHWRRRWEANPTRFVHEDLAPALSTARDALAGFVGAERSGIGFVRNASQGVAAVARSIAGRLQPGDEIVITNHDYNAVRQTLGYVAASRGATLRVVEVPFPIESAGDVSERVLAAVGDRTRLVVIDHITSPTGLVFPVAEIVAALEPVVPVLVDGAHAPGQLPLDLRALGASWYTGNLHKWLCAPKGSAFLHTRADRVEETVPTVISHAWNGPIPPGSSRYVELFDWVGTDDFTPWLVIPDVIEVMGGLVDGGWPDLMRRNHDLAVAARSVICERLGIEAPAPEEMIGSMAAVPLGDDTGADPGGQLAPLNRALLDEGFETVVSIWPSWPHRVLRVSAQHYNHLEEYRLLAEKISELEG